MINEKDGVLEEIGKRSRQNFEPIAPTPLSVVSLKNVNSKEEEKCNSAKWEQVSTKKSGQRHRHSYNAVSRREIQAGVNLEDLLPEKPPLQSLQKMCLEVILKDWKKYPSFDFMAVENSCMLLDMVLQRKQLNYELALRFKRSKNEVIDRLFKEGHLKLITPYRPRTTCRSLPFKNW